MANRKLGVMQLRRNRWIFWETQIHKTTFPHIYATWNDQVSDSCPLILSLCMIPTPNCLRQLTPLNAELNPIFHLLALLGAHHIFHVSGLRVKRDNFCYIQANWKATVSWLLMYVPYIFTCWYVEQSIGPVETCASLLCVWWSRNKNSGRTITPFYYNTCWMVWEKISCRINLTRTSKMNQ